MALEKAKRQQGISAQIGVSRGKFYEGQISNIEQTQKLLNDAQKIFLQEFEQSEIKKGEKLASEATPIYSEKEVPTLSGGTKTVKYVSGYNRPEAFNSSYAADKFDEEIANEYLTQAISDINSLIEDQRALAVASNKPTDDLGIVTSNFLNSIAQSTDLIINELPTDIQKAVKVKTQNLITSATTELQNNHISEAKAYNNFIGKSYVESIDSAMKNAFIDAETNLDIKAEYEKKLDILAGKGSSIAFAYANEFKNGYDKIAKEAGKFNNYFRYDINNSDDITKGIENTIKLRQAAGLGMGKLQLYNFEKKQYEEFNLNDIKLEGVEGRQFLNQLRTTASEQNTVLRALAEDKSVYMLGKNLLNTYDATGSTYNLNATNKNKLAVEFSNVKGDLFKDLIYDYNAKNNTSFTSDNITPEAVAQIQFETIAKTKIIPSNIQKNLELLVNANSIKTMGDIYNNMNFQQLSNFKFESRVGDKSDAIELNVINGLEYIDDKELRDEIKMLDELTDNYGANEGLLMFFDNKKRIQEMAASNKSMKEMFIAQGVSNDDYNNKFTPAKLKEKIIATIQSNTTSVIDPLTDIGIASELVQNITSSLQTKLLLGANRSSNNIEKMIKQEYMSAQTYMGFGRSEYNITPNGILTKNEEVDEVDYYLGKFPIDVFYKNNLEVQKYIENKLDTVAKIRNLRTDAERKDYKFGDNVLLITEGSPNSYDQAVYSLVFIPDKNDPSRMYSMLSDDGATIRFSYTDMVKNVKPDLLPKINVNKYNQELLEQRTQENNKINKLNQSFKAL